MIVLMLDRAINGYLPYIFREKPELRRQFAGFTYYPNVVSFGEHTNFGAPAIFGGYEYTPAEMNRRVSEPLVDKHNEALKVMPVLFDEAGFDVTVCDPPYANYSWVPDLSIFDAYPHIKSYVTEKGQFSSALPFQDVQGRQLNQVWSRNFFCYSLMKISPTFIQSRIYQDGIYYKPNSLALQRIQGSSRAYGQRASFMTSYAVLVSLPDMTRVTDEEQNTFLSMSNMTAHEHTLLREPEYEPALSVDNAEYDREHLDRFILNGRKLHVETDYQMTHYHVNMAAMLQLGRWMDYLREQGVYDNTRIIIIADHGRGLRQFDDMAFEIGTDSSGEILDIMAFNPLFLVKDFDSQEFMTDTSFMTTADVPTIALDGLIENPTNPFTRQSINNQSKFTSNQLITSSHIWVTQENNGNTFLPGIWYSVHDNIFDPGNWENIGEH